MVSVRLRTVLQLGGVETCRGALSCGTPDRGSRRRLRCYAVSQCPRATPRAHTASAANKGGNSGIAANSSHTTGKRGDRADLPKASVSMAPGCHSNATPARATTKRRVRLTFGHLVENHVNQDVGAAPARAVAVNRRREVRTPRP